MSSDRLRRQKKTRDLGTLRQRLRSQLTRGRRRYLLENGGLSYKTPLDLKQQEGQQFRQEYPPAGLLVSRKGTRSPAVVGFLTMFLMKPTES